MQPSNAKDKLEYDCCGTGTVTSKRKPIEQMSFTRLEAGSLFKNSALRFGLTSAFSFLINFAILLLCKEVLAFGEEISFFAGLLVVFFLNFWMCRNFVFNSRNRESSRQLFNFTVSAICFRAMELFFFSALLYAGKFDYRVLAIFTLSLFAAIKFFSLKFFVFKH